MVDAVDVITAVVDGLAVLANLTLLVLIWARTTAPLKTYSILAFNVAIADLIKSLAGIFALQRYVQFGPTVVFPMHGPCQRVGAAACHATSCIILQAVSFGLFSLTACFVFRLQAARSRASCERRLHMVPFALFLPSLFQFLLCNLARTPSEELHEELVEHEDLSSNETTLVGTEDITQSANLIWISIGFGPLIPLLLLMWALRWRILVVLSASTALKSSMKDQHVRLLKGLSMQASLHIVNVLFAITVLLELRDLLPTPLISSIIFQVATTLLPLLNPLITMYFVPSYAVVIHSLLGTPEPKTPAEMAARLDTCPRQASGRMILPPLSPPMPNTVPQELEISDPSM